MLKNIVSILIFLSFLSCVHTKGISNEAKTLVDNGNEYFYKGEYDQAIELYNQALIIEPNYTRAFFNIAYVYWEKREYDKAIEFFTIVIRNEPDNEDAYYWRGRSYLEIRRTQNGINDMMMVISLNKGNESQLKDASTAIGMLYFQDNDYRKAIEYLTLTINRGTNIANIYAYRAVANYYLRNYKMAFEDANEALRRDPDNKVAKELLNIAERDGIIFDERGNVSVSIHIEVGKTISEYIQEYPYLTALSAYLLIDRRSEGEGVLFFYYFNQNTRKLQTAILKNYSSDKRDWFNNILTRYISEGDNIEQKNEPNRRTIYNYTPLEDTDEYKVTQILELDDEAASLYYIIEYKSRQ